MNITNINSANNNKQGVNFKARFSYIESGSYVLDEKAIAKLRDKYVSSFRDPSVGINLTVYEKEENGNILREVLLSYIKNVDFALAETYSEKLSKSTSEKRSALVTVMDSLAKFFEYIDLADPPTKLVKQVSKPEINKPKFTLILNNSEN